MHQNSDSSTVMNVIDHDDKECCHRNAFVFELTDHSKRCASDCDGEGMLEKGALAWGGWGAAKEPVYWLTSRNTIYLSNTAIEHPPHKS